MWIQGFFCHSCRAEIRPYSQSKIAFFLNPGRFGPVPVRSGRFGTGRFGPISGVSRFCPVGGGSFRPYFIGGSFRPVFRGESFWPDLLIVGKQVRY